MLSPFSGKDFILMYLFDMELFSEKFRFVWKQTNMFLTKIVDKNEPSLFNRCFSQHFIIRIKYCQILGTQIVEHGLLTARDGHRRTLGNFKSNPNHKCRIQNFESSFRIQSLGG